MGLLKKHMDTIAIVLCLLFFIAGSVISLNRYWQYEVSYIDFGQYDRAIWEVSRFQEPIFYHFVHGKINVLGDHVTPSVFLMSPLYWLTDRSEMILIVQAFVVGLSGFFLYDIARIVLKKKFLSLSILTNYFLFVGLQNAVITEFHELTIMTLPLMVTFWAAFKEKRVTYWIALLIILGFKESTFLLGIGIGIALFFLNRKWRKRGIVTVLISLLWGFVAFKIILPYFSHDGYLYAASLPVGVMPKALALFDHPLKQKTLFFSLLSFFFLPIFSPQFYLALLQDYAGRFIPLYFTTRWSLSMHYNAQSAVLLSISSVFGLRFLLRIKKLKRYINLLGIIMIINSFILFRFILHGPFMLFINPAFYRHTNDFAFLNKMVDKIPKNAFIATQNNLATRFTHQKVMLLTQDYEREKPEYILLDLREGQSPNNLLGSENVDMILKELLNDPNYRIIYKTDNQYIFKKIIK